MIIAQQQSLALIFCQASQWYLQGTPVFIVCLCHMPGVLRNQLVCKTQVSAVMEFQSQQPCTVAAVVTRGSTPCCAAGYADGCLRLFDLSTAALAWSAYHHSAGAAIFAMHLSPDGMELLTIARLSAGPA